MKGAFADKIPGFDLGPVAKAFWHAADIMAKVGPDEIAPHATAIREAIEKAEFALAQLEQD